MAPAPLRAIWMKNTSALTLDGGSFNVLESEVFAGARIDRPRSSRAKNGCFVRDGFGIAGRGSRMRRRST